MKVEIKNVYEDKDEGIIFDVPIYVITLIPENEADKKFIEEKDFHSDIYTKENNLIVLLQRAYMILM